jgi:hypothetical protein
MAGMDTSHFPGSMFPKIGNAFPTAWETSLSIVVADIVFAQPRPPPAEVSELVFVSRSNESRLALVVQQQLIANDLEQCIQETKGVLAHVNQFSHLCIPTSS